jgi:molecular chaperone Hsp33
MDSVLDIILQQHAYPRAIGLASALKYEGVFTLQAKGDGAVRLLVADVTSDGGVRAFAQFDKDKMGDEQSAVADVNLLGKGFLAFTCTLAGQEDRYQGIVTLEGGTLSEAVQHYFRQSEQVPTGITAAASRDAQGHWHGGCLLLQRMPREGGINVESNTPEAEDWTRAMIVMGTCTPQELTDPELPPNTLLFRLFHEEGVRVYDPQPLRHQCRCTQARVEAMLRALPRDEIEHLTVNGKLTVTCEFCNRSYAYDEAARQTLFAANEA